jgi:hypothetical protein
LHCIRATLAEAKQAAAEATQSLITERATSVNCQARLEAAAREIQAAKDTAAKAVDEAKQAAAEAAELRGQLAQLKKN